MAEGTLTEMWGRPAAKIKETGRDGGKLQRYGDAMWPYCVIEGQGARWRTGQKMIAWNRKGERYGMVDIQKKGSDLEVADGEKMTVPGEGERLFSEVHWSCGEVITAKGDRQTDRWTGWSFSSFLLSVSLIFLFVSKSALHSEQGFQGHLAGLEAWGWISISAVLVNTLELRV